MNKDVHKLSTDVMQGAVIDGKQVAVPSIPYPMFTTKGLSFWKRLGGEKNWRPECDCGRVFETLEDYYAHIVYKNSPYGQDSDD